MKDSGICLVYYFISLPFLNYISYITSKGMKILSDVFWSGGRIGSIVFLFRNLIEGTEESHENFVHDRRTSSRESNPRLPVQEAAVHVAKCLHFFFPKFYLLSVDTTLLCGMDWWAEPV
jgi:hypothetical protein